MQASNGSIIATIIVCALLLGAFGFVTRPEAPEVQKVVVPTAQEIADKITIPPTPVLDTSELLEGIYAEDYDKLEEDAIETCIYEFGDDGIDDIDDLLDDEYDDFEYFTFFKEYNDDREITVTNLGLDDEDDRAVSLSGKIKVNVVYDDGYEDDNDKIYITCEVTSDDGDLEAELDYSLEEPVIE